jgi:Tannase and feruloyl esterase
VGVRAILGSSILIGAIAVIALSPKQALAADGSCTVAAIQRIAPKGMTLGSGGAIDPPEPGLQAAGGVRLIPADALGDGGPGFCYVTGAVVTQSTPRRTAHFAAALPLRRIWNGKFLFQGCGTNCGVIYPPSSEALRKGFAVWATDDGHVAKRSANRQFAREDDATWSVIAPGRLDEGALADFFYRAVHTVTAIGKEFTKRYYASAVKYSYFEGCSDGGREGMLELTRYPRDYDGMIVGAPYFDIASELGTTLVSFAAELRAPGAAIPPRLWGVASRIIMDRCDSEDGVKDGLIQDPEACDFNPYRDLPRCGAGGGGDDCFTREQIDTLSVIFSAKRNPAGEVVYPGWSVSDIGFRSNSADAGDSLVESLGFPQPPSELAAPQPWRANPRGEPEGWYWTEQTARYEVYADRPGFDVRQALGVTFDRGVHGWRGMYAGVGDRAVALLRKMTAAGSGATPRAASRFLRAGRKLIMYHGFSDGDITPYRTVQYFDGLARLNGGMRALQKNARLYMVPGMAHCSGGPGPNNFGQLFSSVVLEAPVNHDILATLEAWVEAGRAPAAIIATKFEHDDPHDRVLRTMPLCPYPAKARFVGTGDVNDAANWVCSANDALLRRAAVGIAAGVFAPGR